MACVQGTVPTGAPGSRLLPPPQLHLWERCLFSWWSPEEGAACWPCHWFVLPQAKATLLPATPFWWPRLVLTSVPFFSSLQESVLAGGTLGWLSVASDSATPVPTR